MNITKIILITLIIVGSCESNLNKKQVTNNNEKITWTSYDEYPSVKACNELIESNLIKNVLRTFYQRNS